MGDKFSFDVPFQWQIIKYTLKDKHGYKALLLYKYEYFDVIDQQLIARAIHKYFKRKHRTPTTSAILNEELNLLFKTRDYAQLILPADHKRIKARVKKLYRGYVKEGDEILHKCKLFASYVEFKKTMEEVDIENFSTYEGFSKKVQKAINLGMEVDEHNKGSFVVAGHLNRITDRYNNEAVIPTPYRQINNLTNAGGYEGGSVVVFMDRPKKGKTLTLTNLAAAYIRRRGNSFKLDEQGKSKGIQKAAKKVIYFDFENGEQAIIMRIDQAVINKTKREILSHEYDHKLKKIYRQFRRLQGEIFVKRMPGLSTVDDLQKIMDDIYSEYGIKFEVAIIDYAALMGARSGAKEDFQRISDVYLDIKNWAKQNNLDIVYTANHVIRNAYKYRLSKYDPEHLAKCIDIERHIDALYGIQQSKLDEEMNVYRFEVIEQRDGFSFGRALFFCDIERQRLIEFTKEEEAAYNKALDDMEGQQNGRESAKNKSERVKKEARGDL